MIFDASRKLGRWTSMRRAGRPTGRCARPYAIQFHGLERRELLTSTALVWDVGVSLPSATAVPAAYSGLNVYGAPGIIVAGGQTPGDSTAVEELGALSSSWTSYPEMNVGRVGPGMVSTPNGLLIFGGAGGSNETTPLSSALMYDQTGVNSHAAASMRTPTMQLAYASDASGQAYAIGGVDNKGHNLATVERYNAGTNAWTVLASLPASRSGAAAAFDGVNSIYVVGGAAAVNGTTGNSTLYKYTISSNSWTTLASLPINIRDAAAVFTPDGQLDVFGGISNGKTVASVETYNPSSNTWITNTPLPSPLSSAAAVVDSLERIEVIGGFNASKQPVAGVEVTQVFGTPVSATSAITSTPGTNATELGSYTYQITANGNPLPVFSLASGPAGMSVDRVSGLLSWSVPATAVGSIPVSVKASDVLGSVTSSFSVNVPDTIAPTAPGKPVLTGLGKTSATIAWGASTDNVGVTSYSVYWIYTTGHSGRGGGVTTHYVLLATTNGSTTSATVSGLPADSFDNLYVLAHDAAGNVSPYSGYVTVTPGVPPQGFTVTGSNSVVANHAIDLQFSATSFLPVTYSVPSPPSGMTIDPNTGIVAWTPTASEVGTVSVTFQASNAFGSSSLVLPITVTPDVPEPGFVFTNTSSPTFNVVNFPIGLQITDASNTPSTFSIVSGPSNASIDPKTGVVNWTPTVAQLSGQTLVFQLTNSAGTATISVTPALYISDAPGNVTISGLDTASPTASWSPPLYNTSLVTGYNILMSGPNYWSYDYTTTSPSTPLYVLVGPGDYILNVQAIGPSGEGLWTSVSFTYNASPPSPTYTVTSGNGSTSGPVGQPVTIQLTDLNTSLPSTWSLYSGPPEMAVDPNTGLVTWTPTSAELGPQDLTFLATNSVGSTYLSLTFVVLFADGTTASVPQNVSAQGSAVSWNPPATVLPNDSIATYEVTVTDSSGNTYPFSVSSPSTSLDLSGLLAAGTYSATVYAVDSYGFAGAVSSPVSISVSSGGGGDNGGDVVMANAGPTPNQAVASPIVPQRSESQATGTKQNWPGATAATIATPILSNQAGHRHRGLVRTAERPRQHAPDHGVHR